MSVHYGVYIKDDHLSGSFTINKDCFNLNKLLLKEGATIFTDFKYYEDPDMIFGELRNCHPSRFFLIFSIYDYVYYTDDTKGSELIPLKEIK